MSLYACMGSICSSYVRGVFAALFAALIFAFIGVLVILINQDGINSFEITYYRGCIQFSVTLIYDVLDVMARQYKQHHKQNDVIFPPLSETTPMLHNTPDNNNTLITEQEEEETSFFKKLRIVRLFTYYDWNRTVRWMILSNIFGGITICCYYYSLTILSLGDAIAVYNIFPVFSFFVAYFILGENMSVSHCIVLILCLIGIILIAQPTFAFGEYSLNSNSSNPVSEFWIMLGYAVCILGAITQALTLVIIRKVKHCGNEILLCILYVHACFLMISGLFGTLTIYRSIWDHSGIFSYFLNLTWMDLNSIGLMGFIACMLLNYSLMRLRAGFASLIRSFDVIFGYAFQIYVLNDRDFNWFTIFGVLAIVLPMTVYTIWHAYTLPNNTTKDVVNFKKESLSNVMYVDISKSEHYNYNYGTVIDTDNI